MIPSYRPVNDRTWRRIVKRMRDTFPLDFPVRVILSDKAPSWAGSDWAAGCYVTFRRSAKGLVADGASVWIDSRQQRSSATDALHHEWAHLMWAEEVGRAEFLHDDRFWILLGKVYRTWHRET